MYKDDLEAARARIAALETELEAEQQQRKAAEAETRAVQARLHELQLASKREAERAGDGDRPARPHRGGRLALLIVGLTTLGIVLLVAAGVIVFLSTSSEPPGQIGPEETVFPPPVSVVPVVPVAPPARQPDPPSLVDPFATSGTRQITPGELLALQRKHRTSLKRCYDRALARDPLLTEVKLDLTVHIGDRGAVREVTVRRSDDQLLSTCIVRAIKRWVFPAAGEQSIGFPIIFRGS